VRPNKKRHRVRAPLDAAHLPSKRNGTSRRGRPWRLSRSRDLDSTVSAQPTNSRSRVVIDRPTGQTRVFAEGTRKYEFANQQYIGSSGCTGLFQPSYFTRRPLKNPALVVFCFILAVSPCSAVFTSPFFFDVSLLTSVLSPVPLWLRLAGGTGGISL